MESVGDLLGRYARKEPDEIALAKQYVADQFGAPAQVAIRGNTLVITVNSAALAATLRLRMVQLQKVCKTDKRLVFRIGSFTA